MKMKFELCHILWNWRNKLNIRRLDGLSMLLAGLMLYAGQSWADTWQHAVSSRISTEYDTNPALSATNPGGVWRALFEPSYTLMGKVGANDYKAGLALQIARSSNSTLSQNRDGPSVFLDWLRQYDTGEFGISSRYEEIATRDAGIDATGLVPITSTRASRILSGSWSKSLSERSTLSANGLYDSVTYKGGTYIDYATQSGSVKFSHALSERSTPFLRIIGDRYVPDGSGPSSSLTNIALGLDWKVEHVDLTMQVSKPRGGGDNTGLLGSLAAQYTGQQSQLVLNADRQIIPSGQVTTASSLGGFVKADLVRGSWSHHLSEYTTTGIDLEWQKNHSITVNNVRSIMGAWLQLNLNPTWVMRTNYQHNIIRGGGAVGASSNVLGLSFVYAHSGF